MSVRLKFAFLAFAMCVLGSATAFSQVRIVADGRLQTILERHIEYNEMSRSIQGYRIRVNSFTGSNAKSKAFALKEELLDKYPKMRAYVTFDEPNFIVKLGDFVSRLDAYAVYSEFRKSVNTAQIIRDWINNPVIDEEDLYVPEYYEDDLEKDF